MIADARNCTGEITYCDSIQATVEPGQAGQSPTGEFHFTSGLGMGRGRIDARPTCLEVNGNTAIIGYAGTVTGFNIHFYLAGLARLRDLGPPDSGEDIVEVSRSDISETPVPGPTTCSSFPGPFPGTVAPPLRNVEGNLFVFDAPAPPDAARSTASHR